MNSTALSSNADLPVRLVCATRLSQEDFLKRSFTGCSACAFAAISNAELTLYSNNTLGLCELYNNAIEAARSSPAILVFIHDDVFLCDFYWADAVRLGLRQFDVVGLVGTRRRLRFQAMWSLWFDQRTGRLVKEEQQYLSGAIGQGTRFLPERIDYFGPAGVECKLLDGLLIAVDSRKLIRTGLRFDPRFQFHLYDMDFCREAERLALRIGTIPLTAVHGSEGSMGQTWDAAFQVYLSKWGD